jgi:hypothetical protein
LISTSAPFFRLTGLPSASVKARDASFYSFEGRAFKGRVAQTVVPELLESIIKSP